MKALGISFSENIFECALVSKEQGKIQISFVKNLPLEDVNQLYNTLGECTWAAGLASDEVLFRKISLPIKEKSKALKALPFQIGSVVSIPLEEMIVSSILNKASPQGWDALTFCAKESALKSLLDSWTSLGIEIEFVTVEQVALYQLLKHFYPQEKECCIILVEKKSLVCVVVSEEQIALSQTVASHELGRLKTFLETKGLWKDSTPAFLLEASSEFVASWKETFSEHILPVPSEILSHPVAIGLALSALAQNPYQANLREGKWACLKTSKKRKKILIQSGILSAIALALCAITSHYFFKLEYQKLHRQAKDLFPSLVLEKPLSSPEALESDLREWEKKTSTSKLPVPLICAVPSAADVLAWISTHPVLTTKEGLPKEGICIQSVRYHLYQYPKLGNSKEPYLAKVEIELIAQTPKLAREFHDALLAGDPLVNAKKEIAWKVEKNTYFTSFEVNPFLGARRP